MKEPKFFALIIGTEILNRRRVDKHFDFITKTLASRSLKLSGSFIIEDNPAFIVQTIKFIASQENPVLFSFGGIGSTPDDHTRKCVAIALRDGKLYEHKEAKDIIVSTLKDDAYPHAINMALLPKNTNLIHNTINNMPAFSIDKRYYFMPGFPEMSHPMVIDILDKLNLSYKKEFRYTLTAKCKESLLIDVMKKMPKDVEFSSLPKLADDGWQVSISVASYNKQLSQDSFYMYIDTLKEKKISFRLN